MVSAIAVGTVVVVSPGSPVSATNPQCEPLAYIRDGSRPIIEVKGAAAGCNAGPTKYLCVELVATASGSIAGGPSCNGGFVGSGATWGYRSFGCSVGLSYFGRMYVKDSAGNKYNYDSTSTMTCTASFAPEA